MTKQEALNIVSLICAEYRGTLKEHEAIQQALLVIRTEPPKKKRATPVDKPADTQQ